MASSPSYYGIVPAGGVGTRFGAALPKQYSLLGGKTLLEHSVTALLSDQRIARVFVIVAPDDDRAGALFAGRERVTVLRLAGKERVNTVLNALKHLLSHLIVNETDWVLVHDAARPGLSAKALGRLIDGASSHVCGGLLALPVADTLKLADPQSEEACVAQTIPRDRVWGAQTPQMFRAQALELAISESLYKGAVVTDEASAIEIMGMRPLLVQGHFENMKVTRPDDLELVRRLMNLPGEAA